MCLFRVYRYEHSCDLLNKRKADLLKVMTAISSPHPSKKDKKKHKDKEKVSIEVSSSMIASDSHGVGGWVGRSCAVMVKGNWFQNTYVHCWPGIANHGVIRKEMCS